MYLPNWPCDLLRRRSGGAPRDDRAAVLLTRRESGRELVAAHCPRAARAGVTVGMTLAHGRALLRGGLRVAEFCPEQDAQALTALARWASRRFSPKVAVDPPEGLLLDLTGCERLFGGERRLVGRLRRAVWRLGFSSRSAVTPSFASAWALARFADVPAVFVGQEQLRSALAPLPVRALRIDAECERALQEVGVLRIEQLLSIPRAEWASRLSEGLRRRVDQALGVGPAELLEVVRPEEPVRVARDFEGPVLQLEAVRLTVEQLVESLCEQLGQRHAGARRVELTLRRVDAGAVVETVSLSEPSRDVRHLRSLLRPRVERAHLGFGVERVELLAARTGVLRLRQLEAWREEASPQPSAMSELIDVLSDRLGADRVLRVSLRASHQPERSFTVTPAIRGNFRGTIRGTIRGDFRGECDGGLKLDYPTLLLDVPEPVRVTMGTPEGPVLGLAAGGVRYQVLRCLGPRRVEGEWWGEGAGGGGTEGQRDKGARRGNPGMSRSPASWVPALRASVPSCLNASPPSAPSSSLSPRDYFQLQDEAGRWWWVFHCERGWFVHGLWA